MRITVLMGVLVTILTGCNAPSNKPPSQCASEKAISATQFTRNIQPVSPDIYQQGLEVVRYGRYILVSTDPTAAQRDPLSQLIEVHIPASQHPTVADALRDVLRQSGYRLCAPEKTNDILYRQPLPSVHYQLGPVRLRTALQLMAGPAWQLEVDEVQREVCHHLRPGYQLPQPRQGKQP
ncbi:PilL N-terminal domain-containing protein [Xenorhabdus bovienii]|uniref:PFGI-1 class ICE element type IV pilus protein PilL2 n=1 Tax=Xenorhabdus bovienii TaxID=40576 RepID=UPI0023B30027|nr:PilL N-terminal domain-containing protein [Xenorhabdus bovienii]MDE9433515.1 PilL N-terminal domain-containing protein [Xenorhabdus bovienii]MDE9442983.1 PilL N-terminal domain-containing protein [Xenorhabdus bovienii]MDE9491155.1 PilL N-terminal domain-containing protein [Xenorhabdus bovienii]MDE9507473.1 PilL N-terminal domain-containing protein [Xenorhabdus bovienii]MDE9547891.1 PilL N-terminal domain-containing protein [Xenorhabdus bovienii]